MNLQELKNTIAGIESAQSNIDGWSKLKNRELCIIPVDSGYYTEFAEWKKSKGSIYDGEKEKSPMYVNSKTANKLLDILINENEDFARPHKEKLSVITNP